MINKIVLQNGKHPVLCETNIYRLNIGLLAFTGVPNKVVSEYISFKSGLFKT